jgi:hypothetical protein
MTSLGILCGTFEWTKHKKYFALTPPEPLATLDAVSLPAITKSQESYIRKGKGDKPSYLPMEQLSPLAIEVPEEEEGYKIGLYAVVHTSEGLKITDQKYEAMNWLSKYLCNRIELQMNKEDEEEANKSNRKQSPTSAPVRRSRIL